MKLWWINYRGAVTIGGLEEDGHDIRISYLGKNYKVWKVDKYTYYNYTLVFTTDTLESSLMYGLQYIEEKYK